jgi:hypothetical protein
MGEEMALMLPTPRARVWQGILIVLAICGLLVSLATRALQLPTACDTLAVRSHSVQVKLQHLDSDATKWVAPPTSPVALQIVSFYARVSPAGPPIASLLFDESLYKRPPPIC